MANRQNPRPQPVRSKPRMTSRPPPPGTAKPCGEAMGPMRSPKINPNYAKMSRENTTGTSGLRAPPKSRNLKPPTNVPRRTDEPTSKKFNLPGRRGLLKEQSLTENPKGLFPPGTCNPYDSSTWHDTPIKYPQEFLEEWERIKPRPRPESPTRYQPSPQGSCGVQRGVQSPHQFMEQRTPSSQYRNVPFTPTAKETLMRSQSPTSGSRIENIRAKLASIREAERTGITTERHLEATLITPQWMSLPPKQRPIPTLSPSPRPSPQQILGVSPPKNVSIDFETTQARLPTTRQLENTTRVDVENLLRRNMINAASHIISVSEMLENTKSPVNLIEEIDEINDFRVEFSDKKPCNSVRGPQQIHSPKDILPRSRSPTIVPCGILLDLNPSPSKESIDDYNSNRPCGTTKSEISYESNTDQNDIDWDYLREESLRVANNIEPGPPLRNQSPIRPNTCSSYRTSENLRSPNRETEQQQPTCGSPKAMTISESFESLEEFPTPSKRGAPCSSRNSPSNHSNILNIHQQKDMDLDWERLQKEAEKVCIDIEVESQLASTPGSEEMITCGDVDQPQFDDEDDGAPRVVCNEEGVPLTTEQIEQIMREYRMQKLVEESDDPYDFSETDEALQLARDEMWSSCSNRQRQKNVAMQIRASLIKMNQRYKAFREKQAATFSPLQEIREEDYIEPEDIEPEIAAAILHTEQQGVPFTESPEKMCEFLFPHEPGEEEEPIMDNSMTQDISFLEGEKKDENKNDILESSEKTHSVSSAHDISPIRYNQIQIRGSNKPYWFPGYYMALPWTDNCIHLMDRPSSALHSAWETLKPSSYNRDNSVLLNH